MLRTRAAQVSLWEAVLPAGGAAAARGVGAGGHAAGRPGVLRAVRAVFRSAGGPAVDPDGDLPADDVPEVPYRLGYETLCGEVADSITWRRFCRIPLDGRVPHPTTLMKLTTRCGTAAVDGCNEALLAKAAQAKLLRTTRLRADTTVVPADVAYPTDSGLLARAVRRIAATGRRIRPPAVRPHPGAGPQPLGRERAHGIAAKLRQRIAQGRDEAQRTVQRITGELAGLAERAAADAQRLVANARRALRRAHTEAEELAAVGGHDAAAGRRRGRLRRAVDELTALLEATGRVVAQARQRLAGIIPTGRPGGSACTTATPARSRRAGSASRSSSATRRRSSTTTTASCSTTPVRGNPADAPQLAPAVGRVIAGPAGVRGSSPPTAATASRVSRTTCTSWACAAWRFPARANRARLARLTNTAARSAAPSSGGPAARVGSAPETGVRLGPNPPGRHRRSPDLDRTRGPGPQPGQDRSPRGMTPLNGEISKSGCGGCPPTGLTRDYFRSK